jgi:predicted NBD/HSP70 family sugar kinase
MLLGIDLGGTKMLALAVDRAGQVCFRARTPTGRGFGPAATIASIEAVVARTGAEAGPVEAVAVGFPGLVDHGRGLARSSVILDGWCEEALAGELERRLGIPCAVDNDVNTAALYEMECRGARDLLFVAVGTGIGGALVLDGRLHRGAGGFAGEIGHLVIDKAGPVCPCGRRGCVNLYASGTAIEERGGARPPAGELGPVEAAAADALGVAIGSALNLVDVPLVVLGGGVAELGSPYLARVASRARRECFAEIGQACAFEAARGGYEAGARGAAALAGQRLAQGRAGQPRSSASAARAAAYARASRGAADG